MTSDLAGADDQQSSVDARAVRTRVLKRAAIVSVFTRAGSTLALLGLTPFVARSLGAERYGVLATLLATSAVLGLSDMGIANGLVSRLATADWESAETEAMLSAATALLAAVSVAGVAISFALAWVLPWPQWLNAPSLGETEMRVAAFAALVGVSLSLTLTLGQKVDLARQRGHVVALWAATASVLGPVMTIIASQIRAPFAVIVAAGAVTPAVVFGLQTLASFSSLPPGNRPSPFRAERTELRIAIRTGGTFFGLAAVMAIAFRVDTLIVSSVLGAAAAAQFDVVVRLFGAGTATVQSALGQLWGAFAEAIARGDAYWARRTLLRASLIAGVASAGANVCLVLVARDVIGFALGEEFQPSVVLIISVGVWMSYQSAMYPLAMFLNGAQLERVQLLIAIPTAIANVALSLILTRRVGAAGPILGSLASHALMSAIPYVLLVRRHLAGLESLEPREAV